ncbi:hypothetical protein [Streptomyces salinarius]|uniref:hypothetical protein n=1 Tax=Streptomyces salinarius TaxID=2762598 RepID=UPI002852D409|nr:hypothetical protein [Streptomyces salinarius]
MGFMRDRANEAKAALENDGPDRAAQLVVHALLEGPTTRGEVLKSLEEDDDA